MVAEKEGRGEGRDRERRREMNEEKWNEGMMFLRTVEEKEEHSQRHLEWSSLNQAMRGEKGEFHWLQGEKERETRS